MLSDSFKEEGMLQNIVSIGSDTFLQFQVSLMDKGGRLY